MRHFLIRLFVISTFSTCLLQGAVLEWDFVKGRGGVLLADNQAPAVTSYDVEIFVDTGAAGDASAVSISGGGIDGSLAFTLEGQEWIYEQDFQTEGAMDAVFPNNATYTITLSGGTLGTLIQTVNVGAKAFPDVPYFTGSVYSDLQDFDPTAGFDFVFATPSGNADLTIIEIEGDGGSLFDVDVAASQTTINMGANILGGGQVYEGYADHVNVVAVSGAGGFGVDGNVAHTAYSRFDVDTMASGSIIGGWTFGDASSDNSGVLVFMKDGNYFHVQDGGPGDQDGFERGTYTWNQETGAFSAQVAQDTNGDIGLSHPDGSPTVSVTGDTLTYTDNEGSFQLTRVKDASNPIVGAWQFGEGRAFDSRILVFLPNGFYFEAQVTNEQVSPDGIEKGSYTWNQETGAFTASVSIDTNGTVGFSDPLESFSISIDGDEMLIRDDDQEWRLYWVDPSTPGFPVPAVTHWRIVKGRDHFQNADNTAPPVSAWSVYVVVETKLNLDARVMELRGSSLNQTYALTQIGRGWTFEKDYHSEAALNAEFPAGGQFTIELSGGDLGTMTQDFTLNNDEYPNTPYLTGTKFTGARSFDSFSDFSLTWSDPGDLTRNSGQVIFEISRLYDDEEVYSVRSFEGSSTGTVPAGTVYPGHTFYGYLEYTHARVLGGEGGFEIDGTDSRNAAVDFTLATPVSPLAGAWTYGDASGEGSGMLMFLNNGTYFHIEDVPSADLDPDGFEKGEYEWDRDSGAFSVETIVDTNGSVGLSDSGDSLSVVVSGNSLTFTDGGEVSVLTKVVRAGDGLVGGWQYADGHDEFGAAYVFLNNGYYFGLHYSQFTGLLLEGGVERGTYSFDEDELALTANALMDTNGEGGLSHVEGEWTAQVYQDNFSYGDNRGGENLVDATMADVRNRLSFFAGNLEPVLRSTVGKQSGYLLRLDVQRILKMNASGRGIDDLEVFQEMYNIRELDLSNNEIMDIWQLDTLVEMRILDLSNNQITDLSPLAMMDKLVSLDVSRNNLSDAGGFGSSSERILPASVSFPLASSGVLAPLDGIDTLDTLKFANNNIVDLSVLASLPALKEVDLSGNDVVDLTPLSQLPLLEKLSVFDNPLDLSNGSDQLDILNTIATNTGAVVVLEAPDPSTANLSWDWDEVNQRFRLIWTVDGTLQRSPDLENWSNEDSSSSPYPVDPESSPLFWRLEF